MTRLRAAAQRAPQSTEAATTLLERYSTVSTQIGLVELARDETVAKAKLAADVELLPLVAELKELHKQLKPWWEASFETLTDGRRKSIELGGCNVGYRMTPPKVVFTGGGEDAMVEALQSAELAMFVRVKAAPDKPTILRALEGDYDESAPLTALGFAAQQREEFFVAPVEG